MVTAKDYFAFTAAKSQLVIEPVNPYPMMF